MVIENIFDVGYKDDMLNKEILPDFDHRKQINESRYFVREFFENQEEIFRYPKRSIF